ncbi:MAG: mandelate racemase/muconate lactonizing enzyme family protein [Lachnospiraceae bacterium]|nr:mandelate racemase/muconate lactonizing enzyme family protein [Lachnospiraceae bacterium]
MSIITNIRTIRLTELPNSIWVEIETDEGLTGLGEAWRGTAAVETVIHNDISHWLLGQDSRRIEYISRTLMTPYVGFHSASAEIRAASAIDIALWDLAGKRHGIPVHEALGGAVRQDIQVYNTCSGYVFNGKSSAYNSGSSRRVIGQNEIMQGPYDDQIAFNQDAGKLAESLLAEGYKVMKIWPFDPFAEKTQGNWISDEDLQKGLEPFRRIRETVGNRMEVMCELHSLWSLPAAVRICQAMEAWDVFWAEDPLCKMDDIQQLQDLRARTRTPVCGSETLAGAVTFRQMFSAGAFDYSMIDLGWCGGLTEGRKIAALAESYNIPLAPHDCTGPVLLWAGLHLALHAPAGLFQEIVRANLATWYQDLVVSLPEIRDGKALLPKAPGLGAVLRPEVKERKDAVIRESSLNA